MRLLEEKGDGDGEGCGGATKVLVFSRPQVKQYGDLLESKKIFAQYHFFITILKFFLAL